MRKRIFTSVIILLSLSSAFHVSRAGNNTAQVDAGKQSEDSRGDVLRSSTLSGAWIIDKPHPKQGGFEGHLAARRAICQGGEQARGKLQRASIARFPQRHRIHRRLLLTKPRQIVSYDRQGITGQDRTCAANTPASVP